MLTSQSQISVEPLVISVGAVLSLFLMVVITPVNAEPNPIRHAFSDIDF